MLLSNLNINNENTKLEIGEKANAAPTQIENRYAYGYNIKTLKKRGGKSAIVSELLDWLKETWRRDDLPTPNNYKFVSADSAKVSWEDASRACDQMKGKLEWIADQKTCR